MSTYMYLICRSHTPPLRADGESGQYLSDLPTIRADLQNRKELIKLYDEYVGFDYSGSYRANTARFLAHHPNCIIGIVDEYGHNHSIKGDRTTMDDTEPILRDDEATLTELLADAEARAMLAEAEAGRTSEEFYDEETLTKVYMALGRAGLADAQITDAIAQMQNVGILFRERTQ